MGKTGKDFDYTKSCWYCGHSQLEPDSRGWRCRHCGATYNLTPAPRHYPIDMKYDYGLGCTTSSPSDSIVKETAQARELAPGGRKTA